MLKQFKKGVKIQITKNFVSTEFDCSCKRPECTVTNIDTDHVEALQKMRDKWGKPVRITSAFRCKAHNAAVGGATNSRHAYGDATDIIVKDVSIEQVSSDCEHFEGKGLYKTFVHIDSRPPGKRKARWDFR